MHYCRDLYRWTVHLSRLTLLISPEFTKHCKVILHSWFGLNPKRNSMGWGTVDMRILAHENFAVNREQGNGGGGGGPRLARWSTAFYGLRQRAMKSNRFPRFTMPPLDPSRPRGRSLHAPRALVAKRGKKEVAQTPYNETTVQGVSSTHVKLHY